MPQKTHDCIDPEKVPCEKARAYLAKKGLLCGTKPAEPVPKKRKKSLLDEWFG